MDSQILDPLDVVGLTPLKGRTGGQPEIVVGLIDGPVFLAHPDLADQNIKEVPGTRPGPCGTADSAASLNGTFVAGILCARHGSAAPRSCRGCTVLIRAIYSGTGPAAREMRRATPEELGETIVD